MRGGNTRGIDVQLPLLQEERYCEWQAARRQLEETARAVTTRRGLFGLIAAALVVARLREEQALLDEKIAGYERELLVGAGTETTAASDGTLAAV